MIKKYLVLLFLFFYMNAQNNSAQIEGLRSNKIGFYALKNLTIITEPGKNITNGVVLIKDGLIQSVGENLQIPSDALIIDYNGLTAYAGFIDLATNYGMPKQINPTEKDKQEKPKGALYWNSNIKSTSNAINNFNFDKDQAEKFRANGITTVLTNNNSGIFKGSSSLVLLNEGIVNDVVIKNEVTQGLSFETDRSGDGYPNSLQGAIALIRQTFYDADWYKNAHAIYAKNPNQMRPEINESLRKISDEKDFKKIFLFEVGDELNLFRAQKISAEFNLNTIYRGSGFEYRRLEELKKINPTIILPINFPDAPNVESLQEAYNIEYSDLQHWDNAPENPARLKKSGINFSLTTSTMKDVGKFLQNLRLAVKRGLNEDDAISALTIIPAKIIGMEKQLGTIENGKFANLILTDGNIFNDKTKIIDVWVAGKKYEVNQISQIDLRGNWNYSFNYSNKIDTGKIEISGEKGSLSSILFFNNKQIKIKTSKLEGKKLSLIFQGDSISQNGIIRITSNYENENLVGNGEFPSGVKFNFNAKRISAFSQPKDSIKKEISENASYEVLYPENPYGIKQIPNQVENLLLKNGTIWTSAKDGILKNYDVIISNGKILKIGKNLLAPKNSTIIDCTNKHITAGLIDAHSHTAISGGVNESGQAITAEARIGDVINSDDVNIYRELAGGLTSANLLHGSANSIGGQNQVIKLRWGSMPEEFKFDGAIQGIKFALGENPKQSNWGDKFTTRYPQTRMGVEQQIRDEFRSAIDYENSFKNYKINSNLIPPRKDLELDAIVELLNKKRVVHAHSYRQDEILMLARVAKDFNFKIATFQHVLEGYKIAEAIKEIGAGASCFTDWWAYKYEVVDAIPYAGALMHKAGVLVSFNSDSNELARRMNLEAAKAIKYGGISVEEAIKFVTINPAKQLMVDNRVGSIEIGKDADFVIWSESPLSTSTKCLQTWIDGRKYFDIDEDKKISDEVVKKRANLIQKILNSGNKNSGGPAKMPSRSSRYSCTDEFLGEN